MIHALATLAQRMRPWLPILMAALLLTVAAFCYLLVAQPVTVQQRYLVPLMVAFLWLLSCLTLILNFAGVRPQRISGGWLHRLGGRLQRLWHWLVALAFLVTTVAAVVLSLRMSLVWLRTDAGG